MKNTNIALSDCAWALLTIRLCFILVLTSVIFGCEKNPDINVMTFNIRYDNPNDGIYQWDRKDYATGIIKKYRIDILGVQEALFDQVVYLDDQFKVFEYIGVGRDDGKRAGNHPTICR